jgi:hypothetical protein
LDFVPSPEPQQEELAACSSALVFRERSRREKRRPKNPCLECSTEVPQVFCESPPEQQLSTLADFPSEEQQLDTSAGFPVFIGVVVIVRILCLELKIAFQIITN